MQLSRVRGDITTMRVHAVVNPANSRMEMGGGVAAAIKAAGGDEIEREAQEHAPVPVGEAICTPAGDLPAKHVIHAPTMEDPGAEIPIEHVRQAMRAALRCADDHGIREIAVPGLGTGTGNVPVDEAAQAMVDAVRAYTGDVVDGVILVAYDDELYAAFQRAMRT